MFKGCSLYLKWGIPLELVVSLKKKKHLHKNILKDIFIASIINLMQQHAVEVAEILKSLLS